MSEKSVIEIPQKSKKNPFEKNPLDRDYILSLVRKWGDVNTDGILDASCQIYMHPDIEGLVGYRIESHQAVVFGDPVCSAQEKPALAKAFQEFCERQHLGVVYTIVSDEFAHWAQKHLSSVLIEFGETFILNPQINPQDQTGSKAGLIRKKVKHALLEGAIVQEYLGNNPKIEQAIEDLALNWQKERRGPQIHLGHFTLFQDRFGKRWFYATHNGEIVGFLILNELQSSNSWLLNNVMISKGAPNGLSELLVISSLQIVEKENCQSVVIGPIPGKTLGKIDGIGSFSSKITRLAYQLIKKVFNLEGHEAFWRKFQPKVQSSYLLFPNKNISFFSVKAILKALNARL